MNVTISLPEKYDKSLFSYVGDFKTLHISDNSNPKQPVFLSILTHEYYEGNNMYMALESYDTEEEALSALRQYFYKSKFEYEFNAQVGFVDLATRRDNEQSFILQTNDSGGYEAETYFSLVVNGKRKLIPDSALYDESSFKDYCRENFEKTCA